MLPKLAEIFGITVDALLGLSAPEPQKAVEAEVVDDLSDSCTGTVNFNLDSSDGKWNIRWDSGRRTTLFLALWVILVGGILLADTVWTLSLGFWEVLWSTGLLLFGIFRLHHKFSVFSLACSLFGIYFLLDHLDVLPFAFTREFLLPLFLLFFGLSLVLDAFRRPRKPRFTVTHDGHRPTQYTLSEKGASSCNLAEHSFNSSVSFGEDTHVIDLPLLRRGQASVSFGESTVDLSGCDQVATGCHIDAGCSFGQLNLRIPRRFRAEIYRSTAFGSVEVSGQPDPEPQGVIFLEADASFGEIRIIYI